MRLGDARVIGQPISVDDNATVCLCRGDRCSDEGMPSIEANGICALLWIPVDE